MNTSLFKIFFFFLLFSCQENEYKKNVIAFNCIRCEGCVIKNLSYIKNNSLHKGYAIILDTNCYYDLMPILKDLDFIQMDNSNIEENFGKFGNFILIDSLSRKTEFYSDMNLVDILE